MSIERRQGFHPNQVEFGQHVRSEIARRPAVQVAQKIAALANATAPEQDPDEAFDPKRHGRRRKLKGSYVAKPDGVLRAGKHTRAIAIVESTASGAAPTEFGGYRNKPKRTLGRAAIAVSVAEFGRYDGYIAGANPGGSA